MSLTHTQINKLKPSEKCTPSRPDKYPCGDHLQLRVRNTGNKVWVSAYRYLGKQQEITIGKYPAMTLKQAKQRNLEIKQLIADGINPKDTKNQTAETVTTFAQVAEEFFISYKKRVADSSFKREYSQYERDIKPKIGKLDINKVTPQQVLSVAKAIEARGSTDMSKRAIDRVGTIYKHAKQHGYTDKNPVLETDLKKALQPHKVKHHDRVSVENLPKLLQNIDNYSGHLLVVKGLWFMAYTFLRTKEMRFLEWSDIDFKAKVIRMPANKMKAKRPHIVPLAPQVITLLNEIKELELSDQYVFLNIHQQKPYSENAFNNALNNMGYRNEMTGHGFRGVASTALHEFGFDHEAIENELAHETTNAVSKAYNGARYLDYRTDMMTKWANFLDNAFKGEIVKIAPPNQVATPKQLLEQLLSLVSKEELLKMIDDS